MLSGAWFRISFQPPLRMTLDEQPPVGQPLEATYVRDGRNERARFEIAPVREVAGEELDRRFAGIKRMLAGQAPEHQPAAMDLVLNKNALHTLPHFHKAALAVSRQRLQHLDALTRSLFDSVSELKGFGRSVAVTDGPFPLSVGSGFVPDPDRLTAAIRAMLDGGHTIEEVDALTGPAIGRPKSASFRTADMVGLDTFLHVAKNVYDRAAADDDRLRLFARHQKARSGIAALRRAT